MSPEQASEAEAEVDKETQQLVENLNEEVAALEDELFPVEGQFKRTLQKHDIIAQSHYSRPRNHEQALTRTKCARK